MTNEQLIGYAIKARENSYSPYSKFKVGCAVLTKGNNVYLGANIENCSYGSTNCAERSALFSAYSNGEREIEKIAIIGSSNDICYPCGVCRQVIAELAPDAQIICAKDTHNYAIYKIEEILPNAFSPNDIE